MMINMFGGGSFSGNPNLCGLPLENACPPLPPPSPPAPKKEKSRKHFSRSMAIYSGYIILGVLVLCYLAYKVVKHYKARKEPSLDGDKKEETNEAIREKTRESSNNEVNGVVSVTRSEYSL